MKAIFFDALGTLVALEPPAPRLRAELRDRFGVAVTEAQAHAALAAEIAYYRANLDAGRDADSLAVLRGRCAEVLRSVLPAGGLEGVDNARVTEALLASLRFTAYPDAAPALLAAREAGLRRIVVSNWDVSLPEVLDRLGLAALVDGVVVSAVVGARKPDPRVFEAALGMAVAGAHEVVHVGDSLEEDVAGARAAMIEPVLIRRDGGAGPPGVRTVSSLAELSKLGRP